MKPTPSKQDQEILRHLEALKSVKVEYPAGLLAERRSAFLARIGSVQRPGVYDFQVIEKEAILEILDQLNQVKTEYPSLLLEKRRAAFLNQIARHRKVSRLAALRSAVQDWFSRIAEALAAPLTNNLRRSLVVVGMLAAAFVGILIFGNRDRLPETPAPLPTQPELARPTLPILPTATYETTKTTCAPDSTSSLCLTQGFVKSPDRDSWVSKGAGSWIEIDTGQIAVVNRVELDREYRRNVVGHFTISVAQSDNLYKQVYDSRSANIPPTVAGSKTIQVSFEPVAARYVRVTFADPGTSVSGVRAYSISQPPTSNQGTDKTGEPPLPTGMASNTPLPTRTRTAVPSNTPTAAPSNTPASTPTKIPTAVPTNSSTPLPTNTPPDTQTPVPTDTPLPTDTALPTDTPLPTDIPLPTDTPLPADTPLPTETLASG